MELLYKGYFIIKPNKKTLTNKQKQWLVDNNYVDSVALDSYDHSSNWEKYFIKHFDWVLLGKQQYGMEVLHLIDKGKGCGHKGDVCYEVHLILYSDKYEELMRIK